MAPAACLLSPRRNVDEGQTAKLLISSIGLVLQKGAERFPARPNAMGFDNLDCLPTTVLNQSPTWHERQL